MQGLLLGLGQPITGPFPLTSWAYNPNAPEYPYDPQRALALLGEALLRSGAAPSQAEFEEAQQALETAISERPNYLSSQLALGKLYLFEGRTADAIVHLEIARNLGPNNPAVYSKLAAAYRKAGDLPKAQDALATLAKLNQEQAERIRTAPGDRKAGYGEVLGSQPRR